MEIYNKRFVYFDWDDNLESKKGFFGDSINHIKLNVKDNRTMWFGEICNNVTRNTDYPFRFIDELGNSHCFRFCYYDPYYEFRKAYIEGKKLQYRNSKGEWENVCGEPIFKGNEYRIEPEWYVVLDDHGLSRTNSKIDDVIVFEGTEDECIKWIDEHKKFEKIMIAWINGAQIELEIPDPIRGIRWISATKPTWDISSNYRIKPEAVESVPFDSVQELIDAWDNKYPQNKNRPEGTMPFIWIKCKEKNRVYLITDFLFEKAYNCDVGTENENLKLIELFEDYTFADGSIIGKIKGE